MGTRRPLRRHPFPVLFLICVCSLVVVAGTDVQINSDAPGTVQNEVRITRNATDGSNLVVAYNDDAGAMSSPLGISFSLDGGSTWFDRQLAIPTHPVLGTPDDTINLPFIFDPFIDSDSQGNIYAGYIATDGAAGGPSGIWIERSTDKGQTWSGASNIDFNLRSNLVAAGAYRFNDRPDMTVDANDDLHVVWIKDVGVNQPTSDIYYAKSPPPGAPGPMNPTGLDFTGGPPGSVAPQTVNDMPNGFDEANAPDVAVAPNGTVYVAWIDVDVTNALPKPGTLKIDRSFNGGVTFGPDLVVANISALSNHLSTTTGAGTFDDARSGSYPVIGVDPSNSATVYMAYAADPMGSDESDIFFIKSTNGGMTWSAPLRINNDLGTTDQFHPVMAVKANGKIDVLWFDKRNSANDDAWDVYFANSTDGGASFSNNARITDTTFSTPLNLPGTEPWFGEYMGVEVGSNTAYIAFTSGVNDNRGDVFFDTFLNEDPLVVELESFTARRVPRGVRIEWTTRTEIDTVGFRLWREVPADDRTPGKERGWTLLTQRPIPAAGTTLEGASYSYLDVLAVDPRVRYYLEDLDRFGRATRHGPVQVLAGERKRTPRTVR